MADLTPVSQWDPVYQLETADPVIGGSGGISNLQAQALANRTQWLRDQIENASQYAGRIEVNGALTPVADLPPDGRTTMNVADVGKIFTSNSTGGSRYLELISAQGTTVPIGTAVDVVNFSDYGTDRGHRLSVAVRWQLTDFSADIIIDPNGLLSDKSVGIFPGEFARFTKVAVGVWMITMRDIATAAGEVIFSASAVEPFGFLKCNGDLQSKAAYPRLYQAIGDTYAQPGDTDANLFRVPELRGEFIRVFDDGRGEDDGRALGDVQSEQIGQHGHVITNVQNELESDGAAFNAFVHGQSDGGNLNQTFGTQLNGSDGDENRPKNVSLAAYIRY